jgi:cation diffusion facilitator family transporter
VSAAGASDAATPGEPSTAHRLSRLTLALNVVICAAGVVAYAFVRSHLLLAQAADSFLDILAGLILVITARVGNLPDDEDHPFGHERAEPIGALVTAILAGILCIEILRNSIESLWEGNFVELGIPVALVFGGKFLVKAALLIGILRVRSRSPVVAATLVDTRNDLLTTSSALLGYFLSRQGHPWADPVFACPIALYIGYAGFSLARENIRFLMGAAPPARVLEELDARVRSVPQIRRVRGLRAHWVGNQLHVEVLVLIDDHKTATQGHDIGVDVQRAVEAHPLVKRAFVHVDTESGKSHQ